MNNWRGIPVLPVVRLTPLLMRLYTVRESLILKGSVVLRHSNTLNRIAIPLPGRYICFLPHLPITAFLLWVTVTCWYSRPSKPLSLHHLVSLVNECQSAAPHTIWQQISLCSQCLCIPWVPLYATAMSSSHTSPAKQMFRMLFTAMIRDSRVQTETSPFSLTKPYRMNYRWWNNL